jgi:molybdopterin-guanine dinucleotide biosynthesis protein A
MYSEIACAILAGGKNSRMGGKSKALLKLNKIPLIQQAINILSTMFNQIIIVTNCPREYVSYNNKAQIITDIIKEAGPLGGIYAALSYSSAKSVFFIACDMPYLHNELIEKQVRLFNNFTNEVLVPHTSGHLQPLHAIYSVNLVTQIETFFSDNSKHSLQRFLSTVDTFNLNLHTKYLKVFTNINTPQELERLPNNHERI